MSSSDVPPMPQPLTQDIQTTTEEAADEEPHLKDHQPGAEETRVEPEKVLETILAHRIKKQEKEPEQAEPTTATSTSPPVTQYEYLVKWKGMSYIHCEWVSESFIVNSRMGKSRLQRFLNRWPPLDPEDPFDENFVLVERIVDTAIIDGIEHFYIKWCNLPYCECTWERAESINDDRQRKEYEKRKINGAKKKTKSQKPTRPRPQDFQEIREGELVFKNDLTLRTYQLEGLNWLLFCWYNRTNNILGDEMGLGKTVQSVAILDQLFRFEDFCGPFLVIVPLSTIDQWRREFERWTDMNVVIFHGNAVSRQIILDYEWYFTDERNFYDMKAGFKFDVLVTTYEIFSTNLSLFTGITWQYAIVDEAHKLKNLGSKSTESLLKLKYDHITLLTGTPIQNNPEELWTLLHVLDAKRFTDYESFVTEFGTLADATQIKKLQGVLKPYLLRRMKEDVEKSIAPKEETIVEVELTRTQKKYYKAILEKNFDHLVRGGKSNNMPSLMNIMVQLRNCCNHPFLLQGVEESELQGVTGKENIFKVLLESSGKMVLIDKLLERLKAGNHKVLIFSQMIRVLDILEDFLNARGYSHERIDGRVRGNDRQAAIDRFSQPGSTTFVFLLCTRAGGLGINLTAADTAIIYDSDWNPQNDLQAQARCHRIGQEKSVKIYRLLTRNTYEREMFDRASKKLGLDHAILSQIDDTEKDPTASNKPTLTSREVDSLLKKGAYDVFNDDDTNAFCEENIDQILSGRTETIIHTEEGKQPSTFSKAHFTPSTAEPSLDVNDPDFWVKLMPEQPNAQPQTEVLATARQKRQSQRLAQIEKTEIEMIESGKLQERDGSMEESDCDSDIDDEFERNPNKSAFPGRNRFQKGLLLFGFGRWRHVKAYAKDMRSDTELGLYGRAFIKRLCAAMDPPIDLDEALKLITIIDPEIPQPDPATLNLNKYDNDLGLNDPFFTNQLKRNAKLYYKRFQLLAHVATLVQSDFKDIIEWPEMKGEAPEWWKTEQDKDLFRGTLLHGFGKYDSMAQNPALSFRPWAPATGKSAKKTPGARGEWPSGKWLTHRFKQALKKIKNNALDEIKMLKKKQKQEEKWTKRDILEFYRFVTTFGLPKNLETKEYDCEFLRSKSKITKSDTEIIKKSKEFVEKCQLTSTMKKEAFEKLGFELTYVQAQRAYEKLLIFEKLHEHIKPLPEETLLELMAPLATPAHKRSLGSFPSWWEPVTHDNQFVKGTLTHGFCKWELILEDPDLLFRAIYQERKKVAEEKAKKCLEDNVAGGEIEDEPMKTRASNGERSEALKQEMELQNEPDHEKGEASKGQQADQNDDFVPEPPKPKKEKIEEVTPPKKKTTRKSRGDTSATGEDGPPKKKAKKKKDKQSSDQMDDDEANGDDITEGDEPATPKAQTAKAMLELPRERFFLKRLELILKIVTNPPPKKKDPPKKKEKTNAKPKKKQKTEHSLAALESETEDSMYVEPSKSEDKKKKEKQTKNNKRKVDPSAEFTPGANGSAPQTKKTKKAATPRTTEATVPFAARAAAFKDSLPLDPTRPNFQAAGNSFQSSAGFHPLPFPLPSQASQKPAYGSGLAPYPSQFQTQFPKSPFLGPSFYPTPLQSASMAQQGGMIPSIHMFRTPPFGGHYNPQYYYSQYQTMQDPRFQPLQYPPLSSGKPVPQPIQTQPTPQQQPATQEQDTPAETT